MDVIFPLNATYIPLDGRLTVVFPLSRSDISAVLQLKLSYILTDTAGGRYNLGASKNEPIPQTRDNGNGTYAFFVHYSNETIAGLLSHFKLELIFTLFLTAPGNATDLSGVGSVNLIYDMYFTTQHGAAPAVVPGMEVKSTNSTNSTNGSNTASSCFPPSPSVFYEQLNITSYVTVESTTSRHSHTTTAIPPVPSRLIRTRPLAFRLEKHLTPPPRPPPAAHRRQAPLRVPPN